MNILVQKFGGSSLANIERIQKAADKILTALTSGYSVVAVVSAMGDETDQLLKLAHKVSHSVVKREYDMLLSTGEQKSMALLAMALQAKNCDALSLTGWQAGIETNAQHMHAKITHIECGLLLNHLKQGSVVIVAGFQGLSLSQEITTLGRGGSDLTAVALASALGAVECQIVTDVDGVYTADPRHITVAHKIPSISYQAMEQFAAAGAQVLHTRSVVLAEKLGVKIRVLAYDQAGEGTIIQSPFSHANPVMVLACHKHLYYCEWHSRADLSSTFRRMQHDGMAIYLLQKRTEKYVFYIPAQQQAWLDEYIANDSCLVDTGQQWAMVSIIGEDQSKFASVFTTVKDLLNTQFCEPEFASRSETQAIFLVGQENCQQVMNQIHSSVIVEQK